MYLRLYLLRLNKRENDSPFFNYQPTQTIMSLYRFSQKNPLPEINIPSGLSIEESTDITLLSRLGDTSENEIISRFANDHLAYVAFLHGTPAAFGWMARGKAFIGEVAHELVLPIANRYLWNFRTLPQFRGLGIYPALLQFMIRHEKKGEHFWIIHAPENKSSMRGIIKAGFEFVGKLYTDNHGTATLDANQLSEEHSYLLNEMDIRLSFETAASCWNCSSPYLKNRKAECCCFPEKEDCIGRSFLVAS
jgi:hypothetical protein